MHHLALTPGRRALLAVVLCAGAVALVGPLGRLAIGMPLLLLAPGYLVERAAPTSRMPALSRLTIWMSLSLSLVALLYLWLSVIGLALADPLLWGVSGLLALAALVAAWHDLGDANLPTPASCLLSPVSCLLAIFAITLWARFVQVDGLALPAWVDSVHHALMVRVAAESGAAPISLRPYLPVDNLPYHWGYHVFAATLMRLSGLELPEALIIPGQILNALVGVAVAGMAGHLWRRPAAAVGAAVAVGLISIMPAYYVSWGRYTQLCGLLMLPGLSIAWGEALRAGGRRRWAIVTLLIAGLSLVHFRVLLFAMALLAAQAVVWAAGQPLPALRSRLLAALAAGAGVAAITAPWAWLLIRRALLPALASDGGLAGGGSYNALSGGLLWSRQNELLIGVGLLGAWLGLRRRAGAAAAMLIWVALLAIESNPWLIVYLTPGAGLLLLLWALRRRSLPAALVGAGLLLINPRTVALPYFWLITNDVVVISLFVPLGVLAGGAAATLYAALPPTRRWPRAAGALAAAAALAVAGWGAYDQRGVLNQGTVLATPADREAIAWAAANTPPDARFMVNSGAWLDATRRGIDGGWWLLPLAGRWTTTPPVLYIYGDPAYVRHTREVEAVVANYRPGQEQAIIDLIAAEGITHIYLGPKVGALTPEVFAGRPGFHTVYQQGGVTIIAVAGP
ncbi:hypothetical protein K2Z83_08745 [Oscillochloris sp. ZM17-4]|uniref:hypothetical protein n=1 Tax=Oscillochloris sp. ZM17-4 TaxID=2866714 RepID=UPI001C7309EF|nr:hypothetical protein [Oscillochloris sp. ZM17-4]MBX0327763.1 hypothetical protein [Oscillochloris sp. ZM17-4]